MDFQELNNDRKLFSATQKAEKYIDRGFSIKAKDLVTQSAILGGISLAFPLFGLDNIIYAIILWSMYVRLCSLAKKSFGGNLSKSFIGAFIVNFIVTGVLELIFSFIPVGGIIAAFIIGYISIKMSGAAYLKALEMLHNGNVAERYTFNR